MCIDLLVAFAAVMPAGMLKCSRLTCCATAIDMPATAAPSLSFLFTTQQVMPRAGLSLYSVEAAAMVKNTQKGKRKATTAARAGLLFTHRGYSGPAVLDLSHHAIMAAARGLDKPGTASEGARLSWNMCEACCCCCVQRVDLQTCQHNDCCQASPLIGSASESPVCLCLWRCQAMLMTRLWIECMSALQSSK